MRRFQTDRGLHVDGVCGPQTWAALVEASYRLGDRLLYERRPMLRGDDVHELQSRLGRLGFDAGRVDGIFGPQTAAALTDFQRNAGLPADAICGPDTLAALGRVSGRAGPSTRAEVRERDALRHGPRHLHGRRIMLGETGGLAALADALRRSLAGGGAVVGLSHHPDGSAQAADANAFGAELYLGLALVDAPTCRGAYYAAGDFRSSGGCRLAELVAAEAAGVLGTQGSTNGMRLPALRETRMPAVLCELGPPVAVVQEVATLAPALGRAVERWVVTPVEG